MLQREFMPPLDEGSFLYMPSLLPQAGLGPAGQVNSIQDRAIASVPEVESVVGKLGRAESALDPAPISMMESIIILKPVDDWRQFPVKRWFSGWPAWLKKPFAFFAPEQRTITKNEILTELQQKTAIPGVLPTFLQPIQTRLVMLQTGFRAMMGVKIYGSDLKEIKRIRPCLMTLSTTVFGLMPIFWASGRGSDVMRPMAIPSIGGLAVSLCVSIFIAPTLFCAVEEWKWKRAQRDTRNRR